MDTDLHPDEKNKNGFLSEDTLTIEMEYSRILLFSICMFELKVEF
jgi:hypothetical protein